jgi:DNA-directed RNA polymerase specialized sigma24 family protein
VIAVRLVRDVKREALAHMEAAARTIDDFNAVIRQWDKLDENRERKERAHEIGRDEQKIDVGYTDGAIIPAPISHPAWREAMKGDFLSLIFDNADEIWQLVEDEDISPLVKNLTAKQRDVLFLSAVRQCTSMQVACYRDVTDRAVRKLLAAALRSIREKLTDIIQEQIAAGSPCLTPAKRDFIERSKGTG